MSSRKRVLGVCIAVLGGLTATVAATAPIASATCSISSTLRNGTRSDDVICLETTLRALGYTQVVGPDRSFGTSTRTAVKAFQRSKGLTIDGVVGPRTGSALGIWARCRLP